MTKPIHHITLTVTDVTTSVAWYQALFGRAELVEREREGGVMSHDAAQEGTFSHLNRDLDHIGIEHGPIEDAPYAWTVTARDPDNIPIEFFCAK